MTSCLLSFEVYKSHGCTFCNGFNRVKIPKITIILIIKCDIEENLAFRKQLGGKLGTSLQSDLGINTVGDLLQFSEEKLQQRYGINTG
jgi:hypothetical protein